MYPDVHVVFTDGLDRGFEADIFLVQFKFILCLQGIADILAGDGAEDSAVFPGFHRDDHFHFFQLGSHDDCFIRGHFILEYFGFLALGCGIQVGFGAFHAQAFADEYVAAVTVGNFHNVSFLAHFLDIL